MRSGGSDPSDLGVLRDGAARDADGAEQLAVGTSQRDASAERRQAAVRELEAGRGRAGFAVLPDDFAVGLEQRGGAGLLHARGRWSRGPRHPCA